VSSKQPSQKKENLLRMWDNHIADWWQRQLSVPAVYLYGTIPSTNDIARDLAEQGAEPLTIVIADQQTAGRGRAGSTWMSSAGSSLLCSILFRTHADAHAAPGAAPVRIGNAVAQAIEDAAGVPALLKWPNDVIVLEQGKVAGILCEATVRQHGTAHIVAGIGVNVSSPGSNYGSINAAAGSEITRGALLEHIVALLKPLAPRITFPLSDSELASIKARDILLGERVETETGLMGRASGIAQDGSLRVETAEGTRSIYSATIRWADTKAYPGARA
jgi:BirA family biotin operon repressor/biotin-[acetyl-CoA-carboxylase] ligase